MNNLTKHLIFTVIICFPLLTQAIPPYTPPPPYSIPYDASITREALFEKTSARPGSTVSFEITIENTGKNQDTYTIEQVGIKPQDVDYLEISVPDIGPITLASKEKKVFTVDFHINDKATTRKELVGGYLIFKSKNETSKYLGESMQFFVVTEEDIDGDTVLNKNDSCPTKFTYTQRDTDKDGVGDDCDNCGAHYNPGQENSDSNSQGDACQKPVSDERQVGSDWGIKQILYSISFIFVLSILVLGYKRFKNKIT